MVTRLDPKTFDATTEITWCAGCGDFAILKALKLALAAPYEFDRADARREKELLLASWGDWAELKEKLPRGHARSLVDYLRVHPADFKGAVARLRPELRSLYVSAYQSHLWNRMLGRLIEQVCRPDQILRVRLRLGRVPMHRALDDRQRTILAGSQLPLPSARLKIDSSDPRLALIESVLAEEGMKLHELKLKGFRGKTLVLYFFPRAGTPG